MSDPPTPNWGTALILAAATQDTVTMFRLMAQLVLESEDPQESAESCQKLQVIAEAGAMISSAAIAMHELSHETTREDLLANLALSDEEMLAMMHAGREAYDALKDGLSDPSDAEGVLITPEDLLAALGLSTDTAEDVEYPATGTEG